MSELGCGGMSPVTCRMVCCISGNTAHGPEQPSVSTSGNRRTGRPRRASDLPGDLAGELAAFTEKLAAGTRLGRPLAMAPEQIRTEIQEKA